MLLTKKRWGVNVTRTAATRQEGGVDGAAGKEGGAEEEEMPLQRQLEERTTEARRTIAASVESAAANEVFQTGTRMAPGVYI